MFHKDIWTMHAIICVFSTQAQKPERIFQTHDFFFSLQENLVHIFWTRAEKNGMKLLFMQTFIYCTEKKLLYACNKLVCEYAIKTLYEWVEAYYSRQMNCFCFRLVIFS